MTKQIKNLIKPVLRNGEVVTHRVTDPSLDIRDFFSSTFIQKQSVIVKGEYLIENESRKARLVFLDLESGKVLGRVTCICF